MGSGRSARPRCWAETLLSEADFAEVGLAMWLESPDGQLVRSVVVGLLPPWQRLEAELLVEGVMAAAQARRRNQQGLAAVLAADECVLCGQGLGRGGRKLTRCQTPRPLPVCSEPRLIVARRCVLERARIVTPTDFRQAGRPQGYPAEVRRSLLARRRAVVPGASRGLANRYP